MSTDEQATKASGSVPHAYGNAIAWKWSREMPRALKPGVLTLLYALRSMANANGELRFHGDHKPIRIQDIAKAAGADEKDARDRMEAAIVAGVVVVKGERRRGKSTLYSLAVSPCPNWAAAVAFLDDVKQKREAAKQKRADRKAAPWDVEDGEKFGGRSPELADSEFGGPTPELTGGTAEEVRGTDPRLSSGDRPPNGSGDRPPNNPGSTQEISQEVAEVGSQPQVGGAPELPKIDSPQEQPHTPPADTEPAPADAEPPPLADFTRCAHCHERMIPRPGRTTHAHCPPPADRTTR
ncbi:hypothetical protein U9R90_25075 [Streptomyces sp. E11-3]|uniref:hypothetical protein n=1 Tax=Streptomyces sp. E11-3 TaxID=3110112 RepID=UPI00397F8840